MRHFSLRSSSILATSLMACVILTGLGREPLGATTLLDDFTYVTGNLAGQNGGTGWTTAWGASNGTSGFVKTDSTTDLTYSGGGYAITQTGTGSGFGSYFQYRGGTRAAPNMTGTIWFSILLQDVSAAYTTHAGIQFNNPLTMALDYNPSPFQIDLTGGSLNVYDGSTTAFTTAATGLATGTTHLVVGSISMGAGADTLNVWVDPSNLSSLGTAAYTNNSVDIGNALTNVGVFGYGDNGTVSGVTYGRFDALRVSNDANGFTAVTGVSTTPEPGRTMLSALGLGVLLLRRRRHASAQA